jgi:hypothetical protein
LPKTNAPQFGAVLRTLLIDAGIVTKMGNPDWMSFSEQLVGVTYESLRKAIVGERAPSEKILLVAAAALNVDASVFIEYRLLEARRSLDPSQVGWKSAVEALQRMDSLS